MITNDVSTCPKCGGDLKYYDRVTRIVRTKGRKTWKIPMRRLALIAVLYIESFPN